MAMRKFYSLLETGYISLVADGNKPLRSSELIIVIFVLGQFYFWFCFDFETIGLIIVGGTFGESR
ncbi:hypothetical protein M6B38_287760 [Iris pallida]|uniref:Uncharacterized protein n=1 Tax=Iris pallida TaxID=29817 RepID=A0AAX6HXR8_IRIPA|nr:hypothetical protein M6B38_287760 [Iris pallida]